MRCGSLYIGLLLAGISLWGGSVCAAPTPDQLQAIEEQAFSQRKKHKRLQAQATQINMELNKLNQNMIKAAKKLQQQEAAMTESETKLKFLSEKLDVSQQDFKRENKKLAEMLRALQNLATHPTQSMLVMPLKPVEVVRSAILMRESVPYLNDRARKIKADLDKIARQKQDVENQLQKLTKQKLALEQQQEKLKKMSAQKVALRKKIEGESQKSKQEAMRLASQASDLRELLEKAEQEQKLRLRKQEEIRRAAKAREEEAQKRLEEEQRRRLKQGAGSGLKTQDGEDYRDQLEENVNLIQIEPQKTLNTAIDFSGAKGKLTKPVTGNILTSYGQELSKGVTSKGIIFKTRAGAQVVAPYDGTVIFSGPFKGYGNLIIVEHGQGYVSLLAGMSTVDTENGQMVLAGEPVGKMPDADTAKLYVEIRKNQRPVNPAPWFGK